MTYNKWYENPDHEPKPGPHPDVDHEWNTKPELFRHLMKVDNQDNKMNDNNNWE